MFAEALIWLCRSPRRLAIGAVALLTVVLVAGTTLFGSGAGAGAAQGPTQRPTPPASVGNAQVPDAAPFISVAVDFVRQWSQLRPGESQDQWLTRLEPLTTRDFEAALRTTDPQALPGVGPAGDPVVRYVAQTSALVAVPLANGSAVLVSVVSSAQGLRVSDVQPHVGD